MGIVGAGVSRLMCNGHPDLMRCLRRQPMKAQCRQQTNDSVRHALRCLDQSMVFSYTATLGYVYSSADAPHQSALLRLAKVLSWNPDLFKLTRPEYSGFPDKASDLVVLLFDLKAEAWTELVKMTALDPARFARWKVCLFQLNL